MQIEGVAVGIDLEWHLKASAFFPKAKSVSEVRSISKTDPIKQQVVVECEYPAEG